MREEEKLIPVTSKSQLKPGALAVVKPCECGSSHRVLVLGDGRPHTRCRRGSIRTTDYVCSDGFDGNALCAACSIEAGVIFIVDTGLESDATTETKRPARKPEGATT